MIWISSLTLIRPLPIFSFLLQTILFGLQLYSVLTKPQVLDPLDRFKPISTAPIVTTHLQGAKGEGDIWCVLSFTRKMLRRLFIESLRREFFSWNWVKKFLEIIWRVSSESRNILAWIFLNLQRKILLRWVSDHYILSLSLSLSLYLALSHARTHTLSLSLSIPLSPLSLNPSLS